MAYSKKIFITIWLLVASNFLGSRLALACAVCDSQLGQAVRSEIIHTQFLLFSSSIFILFFTFWGLVLLIQQFIFYRENKNNTVSNHKEALNRYPLVSAGMLIGGAVAGFLDAILFHQLLQTHAMVSDYLPITALVNVKVNMFWDGLFELFTLTTLLVGLMFFWRVRRDSDLSPRIFIGWFLLGFGLFNFLEGLLDHEILGLHHVLQQTAEQWVSYADKIFLLVAFIFICIGIVLIKAAHKI